MWCIKMDAIFLFIEHNMSYDKHHFWFADENARRFSNYVCITGRSFHEFSLPAFLKTLLTDEQYCNK